MPYTRDLYGGQEGLGRAHSCGIDHHLSREWARTSVPLTPASNSAYRFVRATGRRGVPLAFEQWNRGRAAAIPQREEQD